MERKKSIKKTKKITSKNNKGFTLIEIIAVVIIIGILIVVSGISVTNYIEDSRAKTYESYKKDLAGASENYLIDCMTNNEEGCIIPDYGNDLRISYTELEEKGYTEKLKDPEGDGYCDKSYVIAKNKSSNGVDIEYKVCLYCSNYKTDDAGCKETNSGDTTPPTCGTTKGDSTTWSKENKVITVACKDSGIGCAKSEFSSSIGKEGEVIKTGTVTIQDKDGNTKACPVNVYVDKQAPTCKIELDKTATNGWYKAGVTARITSISDGQGSGVAESGMGTSLVNRTYNGLTSYEVTGGIVTVFGYVKDNVGNEGYCSKEVRIDNTNPEGTIYMGYEVYPKENSTKSEAILTINNTGKYGDIEGVIVYFSENLSANLASKITDGKGTAIKTSGGLTIGNNKGIFKVTKGTYDTLKIDVSNNTYASKITRVEVIKKENETSVWTNKNISVYVEAKDTITGVNVYSYDGGNTYVSNNIKNYSENINGNVVIKDKVGNVSVSYPFTINKIDKISPNVPTSEVKYDSSTGNLRGNVNAWTNRTLWWGNYNATDNGGSGINHYEFSRDCKTKAGNLVTSYTYSSNINSSYCIRSVDNAGNASEWSETYYFKIDKTDPTCGTINLSGTLGNNGWYKSAVTVSKTDGSDADSGHNSTTVSPSSINSNTDGTTVTLTTTDKAGNTCTTTKTVKIDKTKPNVPTSSVKYDSSTGNLRGNVNEWTNRTLWWGNYSATDNGGSGINHYEFSRDCKIKAGNLTTSYTYSSNINSSYCIRSVDNAGNASEWSETYYFKIDKTDPTCGTINLSGTVGNNGWYKSAVTVSKTDGSDADSGHNSTTVSTSSITSNTDGTTVTLTTTDKAGNTCTTTKTVKIDKTKPTCGTIKLSGTAGKNGWYISNVTVSKTDGSDADSGHNSTTVSTSSITSNTDGTTVTLTTTDKAGNTCTTTKTVKVDKTKPTVTISPQNNGTCDLTDPKWTKCRKFEIKDSYSETLFLIRSHCAVPQLASQNDPENYCVDGYSAKERLTHFYNNLKDKLYDFDNLGNATLYSKDKDTKSVVERFYSSNKTKELRTSFNKNYEVQYAFIVCDQAGNCSSMYTYTN